LNFFSRHRLALLRSFSLVVSPCFASLAVSSHPHSHRSACSRASLSPFGSVSPITLTVRLGLAPQSHHSARSRPSLSPFGLVLPLTLTIRLGLALHSHHSARSRPSHLRFPPDAFSFRLAPSASAPSTSGYHADSTVDFRLQRRLDSPCSAPVIHPSGLWLGFNSPSSALRQLPAATPIWLSISVNYADSTHRAPRRSIIHP
jgi:hypothetical protein